MKYELKRLMILLIFLLIKPGSNPVNAELIALWEFEYDSANDSCGDNHGNFVGYPAFSAGHKDIDRALELNGNDYISIDNESNFDITDKITVAAWIKVEKFDKPWQAVIAKGDSAWRMARTNQEETLAFHLTGITSDNNGRHENLGVEGNVNVEDGQWHHAVGVYDGSTIYLYMDGVLDRSLDATGTIATNNYDVCIGGNAEWEGRCFNGLIDDVAVFNHALSESDVQQLYKTGGASFIPKGYIVKLTEEAETAIKDLEPEEAVVLLETKIVEYEKWKARNTNQIKLHDNHLSSDMYFLLARAKEAANAPPQDVIETYKRAVSQPHRPLNYIPDALVWLSENIPADEYVDIVKKCISNSSEPSCYIYNIARFFESKDKWSAFELFLDALLSEANDHLNYFIVIDRALRKDGAWSDKFLQYCRSKPELTEFIFYNLEKTARNHIEQKNFTEAAKIYNEIIKKCGPNQKKAMYELKLHECLFDGGQYDKVIETIDSFIKSCKTSERALTIKAILLKGRVCVYMGNPDAAIDTFLKLIIEYPQSKQAPEANFIMGYCLMLQGNYQEATEAFNLLISDYRESSYAAQAESYLQRIKNMTE